MKQIISAVLLSVLLHFIILYSYKPEITNPSYEKKVKKDKNRSALRYVQLKKTKEVKKEKVNKSTKKKELKRVINKQEIKKAKKVKYKEVKKIKKTAKRVFKKTKKKTISKKPITKEEVLPNFLKLNPTQLQNDIIKDINEEPLDLRMLDQITQSYIKLYGSEYNNFTKVQKVFLQNSLRSIGRITQKYLRYPRISAKMRQSGMNIVEFILYPNGDISEPKIINSSKHLPLDKNTLDTIKIAYKDYPRPKEPTKIRIYVTYRLY